MRMAFGLRCWSVWVASTCSTSLVPMPKASAPKAPWVEGCESPPTIVMPGCVTPTSGPTTWTRRYAGRPAAAERQARLRAAERGPDHVDDALPAMPAAIAADAELLAVRVERVEL